METTIKKWGNSLALRIPRSIAAEAGVAYGSTIDIRVEDGAIVARATDKTTYDLKALLRKVRKENLHGEVFTGRRKGREVW